MSDTSDPENDRVLSRHQALLHTPPDALPPRANPFFTALQDSTLPRRTLRSRRPRTLFDPSNMTARTPPRNKDAPPNDKEGAAPGSAGAGGSATGTNSAVTNDSAAANVNIPHDRGPHPSTSKTLPEHQATFAGKLLLTCFNKGGKTLHADAVEAGLAVLNGTATDEQVLRLT